MSEPPTLPPGDVVASIATDPHEVGPGQRYLGAVLNKVIEFDDETTTGLPAGQCIRKGIKVAFGQLYADGDADADAATTPGGFAYTSEQLNDTSRSPAASQLETNTLCVTQPASEADSLSVDHDNDNDNTTHHEEETEEREETPPIPSSPVRVGTATPPILEANGKSEALCEAVAAALPEKKETKKKKKKEQRTPEAVLETILQDTGEKPEIHKEQKETREAPQQRSARSSLAARETMGSQQPGQSRGSFVPRTSVSSRRGSFAGNDPFTRTTNVGDIATALTGVGAPKWATLDQQQKKEAVDERIIRMLHKLRDHHVQHEKRIKEKLHETASLLHQTQHEMKKQKREYENVIQDYEETVEVLKLNSVVGAQENHARADTDRREQDRQRHDEELADIHLHHSLDLQQLQETVKNMKEHICALEEDNEILHQDIARGQELRDELEEEVRGGIDSKALLEFTEAQNAELMQENEAMRQDLLHLEEVKMRAEDDLNAMKSQHEKVRYSVQNNFDLHNYG